MSDNSYQLIVRTGPKPGHVYMLISDSMVIGRDPNSDIVINDAEVSRQHARLTMGADGYQIQDMGSTNGSFVDGARLEGATVSMNNGQIVQLGSNVELVYQVIEGVDPMATMVAPMGALPDMGLPDAEEDVDTGILPSVSEDEVPSITAFDEQEDELADLPSFDEPAATFDEIADDLPSFDDIDEVAAAAVEEVAADVEALPSFDEPPEDATMIFSESMADDLPSFDEPVEDAAAEVEAALPSFDEPEPMPSFDEPEAALPSFDEPEPLPSFDEPEPLPSFDEPEPLPTFDDPEPLPSFDEPAAAEPVMAKSEPPPLPSFDPEPVAADVSKVGAAEGESNNNRRNIMIAAGVLVGLCLCCSVIAAAVYLSGGLAGF